MIFFLYCLIGTYCFNGEPVFIFIIGLPSLILASITTASSQKFPKGALSLSIIQLLAYLFFHLQSFNINSSPVYIGTLSLLIFIQSLGIVNATKYIKQTTYNKAKHHQDC